MPAPVGAHTCQHSPRRPALHPASFVIVFCRLPASSGPRTLSQPLRWETGEGASSGPLCPGKPRFTCKYMSGIRSGWPLHALTQAAGPLCLSSACPPLPPREWDGMGVGGGENTLLQGYIASEARTLALKLKVQYLAPFASLPVSWNSPALETSRLLFAAGQGGMTYQQTPD